MKTPSTERRASSAARWCCWSRAAVPQELRHLPVQLLAGVRDRDDGAQPDRRLRRARSRSGHAAFFGIGAYIVAILLKAGVQLLARAAAGGGRLLRRRPGARLPGAARADHLPRVRHARLQHRAVAGDAQRGVAHRRHVRHQQHPAARRCSAGPVDGNLRLLLLHARRRACCSCALLWWLLRSPWGKAFTALRDNPIRAESLGVNIQPTRCWRSRSARRMRASPARCSRRWCEFIEPAPFAVGASIMMYLMVVVGGAGLLLRPVLGTVSRRAAARVAALRAGAGTCSCSAPRWSC